MLLSCDGGAVLRVEGFADSDCSSEGISDDEDGLESGCSSGDIDETDGAVLGFPDICDGEKDVTKVGGVFFIRDGDVEVISDGGSVRWPWVGCIECAVGKFERADNTGTSDGVNDRLYVGCFEGTLLGNSTSEGYKVGISNISCDVEGCGEGLLVFGTFCR